MGMLNYCKVGAFAGSKKRLPKKTLLNLVRLSAGCLQRCAHHPLPAAFVLPKAVLKLAVLLN